MSLGSPTSHNTATTGSTFSSRSGTFDLSSRVSSRTGSFDLVQRRDEILPTQCYVCQSKFSSTVHSVLTLCECRVSVCQQCAMNSMIMNEDFALDCMICGFKVDSSTNTGIIRNVSKVKDLTDKLLERAFRFCRVPVPSMKDPTLSQFYPLLAKFSKIPGISPHLQEFLRTNDAGENAQKERRKLNVNYLKLQLARAEYMRAGPLKDEVMEPGNLNVPETSGLPLGPLQCLSLTRNVYLDRLLALCDSDCFSGCSKEIDPACVTCHEPIQSGESILLSCDCDVLMCRGCAIRGFMSSKYTYRKGVCCPSCSKCSMISMSNVEKAKEEEMSIIDMMIRKYSPMGVTYSSKSIMDLRKLLEHVYSLGLAPCTKTRDEIHGMSFHQVELELSRIYVAIERKKSKHEKLIKKEKKADKKKNSVDEKEAEFDEAEMKGKKGGKKKGEKEAELVFDQVVSYDNKEDENYLYEESVRDQGFDLPIGPLRLLRFKTNPFVELYLANNLNTDSMDPHEREIAELVQKHRFNPFKPKFNTPCPRCTINPQNMDYVRTHLKTCHAISRKDEIEKVMKTVTLQSVDGSHHFLFPSFGGSMDGSVVSPPRPPVQGRGMVSASELSIRLSNMEEGLHA